MRTRRRVTLMAMFLIGLALALAGSSAKAQDPGLGGILGGYGAMSGSSMGGGLSVVDPSAMGGNIVVPAAGGSASAMTTPSMRGGELSFRPRSAASSSSTRPSLRLDSMSGMTGKGAGMGRRRPFALEPGNLSGGMGLGGTRRMPASGMGVMPPSLGYPFRQPPGLLAPSASGAGMSM